MSQKIKDGLTTSYMLFVFDFGDPAAVDREAVEKQIGISLGHIFDTRPGCHRAVQRLGKAKFKKVMALYFMDFKKKDNVDGEKLAVKIERGREMMKRHLGKDVLLYLDLLIKMANAIESPLPKRGGLLFEEEIV